MTTYLLDVNVLIALSDPMHIHHEAAHRWFGSMGRHDWATCPMTENGFVRVASHPKYPNRPGGASVVLTMLRQLCAAEGHRLWAETISIRDLLLPGAIVSHHHLTDVYLLGVAANYNGKLATLDQRIPTSLIEGGDDALELIAV